jgi:hypothetical protein
VPTSGAEAPTHYRITGTKDLINGGGSNTWLITLVSVEGGDGARGLSLLAVRRDETVSVTRQWTTLPTPAADIASVRFSGTVVAADHVVGRIGSGHRLVMHRLARSRGGISALAAGTTAQAVKLTDDYLHHREIHGRPLWAYPALIGHIHRLEAIDLAVACLCAKTELVMSSPELEPAYMTAVAKLSCCQWAERAVDEGRQLMSARALLEQSPYTRLVRDVLLFSVFDGSRHVILAQLSKYVGQLITPADEPADVLLRSALEGPPIGWREASLPCLARPTVPDLGQHLDWLADKAGQCKPVSVALSRVAHLVKAQIAEWVASGCWKDQTVAFGASQAVADLEMGAALLGFGHAPCRAALGLPAMTQDGHDDARVDTAASMLGMAAAAWRPKARPMEGMRVRRKGLRKLLRCRRVERRGIVAMRWSWC